MGLGRVAAKIAKESKETGRIKKYRIPYLKGKIEQFEYNEGNIARTIGYKQIFKEEWEWREIFELVEQEIKNMEYFDKVSSLISSTFGVEKAQAEYWIS